jgi:hypothetical protein
MLPCLSQPLLSKVSSAGGLHLDESIELILLQLRQLKDSIGVFSSATTTVSHAAYFEI